MGHEEEYIKSTNDSMADKPSIDEDNERIYPCNDCGKLRSKAEGGTTLTFCDECWDKRYKKPTKPSTGNLFNFGRFTLHSGETSDFKIDCDALTNDDWDCLAYMISARYKYDRVVGIPEGGLKLARALRQYSLNGEPTLIVDDVLTTGNSFEDARSKISEESFGVVVFARGKCPDWVTSLFQFEADKPSTANREAVRQAIIKAFGLTYPEVKTLGDIADVATDEILSPIERKVNDER